MFTWMHVWSSQYFVILAITICVEKRRVLFRPAPPRTVEDVCCSPGTRAPGRVCAFRVSIHTGRLAHYSMSNAFVIFYCLILIAAFDGHMVIRPAPAAYCIKIVPHSHCLIPAHPHFPPITHTAPPPFKRQGVEASASLCICEESYWLATVLNFSLAALWLNPLHPPPPPPSSTLCV